MILVTGGTGFLGSRLLFDLTSRGEKVKAIKRPSSNLDAVRRVFSYYGENPGELLYRIDWIDADIMDIDSLMYVMQNVRQVYHAAAFVSFDPKDREKLMKNNIEGTRNVVNACLTNSVEKLCHVSSTAALGLPDADGITRENSYWASERFNTGYAISKYYSELEVWRGIEEGLKTIIVNPSIILGPGFWDRGSSQMFSIIYRGHKFYTLGETGYVSVADVSQAMLALMKSHYFGERFILSSENLSYKQIFELISKSLGEKPSLIEATNFLGNMAWRFENLKAIFGAKKRFTREMFLAGQNKVRFSNEKFTRAFNVEFQPVAETIRDIVKYFRKDLQEGWLDKGAIKWNMPWPSV